MGVKKPARGGVRPHTGARIETRIERANSSASLVRPHTGARIETKYRFYADWCCAVRPHTGARIETCSAVARWLRSR